MLTHQQLLGNYRSGLCATLFWQSCVSWWPNFSTCRRVSHVQRSSVKPLCVAAPFQQTCHCTTSVPRSSRLFSLYAIVTLRVCLCKEQRAWNSLLNNRLLEVSVLSERLPEDTWTVSDMNANQNAKRSTWVLILAWLVKLFLHRRPQRDVQLV